MIDEGYARVKMQLPALITVVKEINTPRFPDLAGFRRAQRAEITTWQADDLEVEPERLGLEGSPTQVISTFVPERHKTCRQVEGTSQEIAQQVLDSLEQKGWEPQHG